MEIGLGMNYSVFGIEGLAKHIKHLSDVTGNTSSFLPSTLASKSIMAGDKSSSKSKRSSDHDREHKSKKRNKHVDDDKRERKRKRKDGDKLRVVDDDPDEDMWVEKNIDMDGEKVRSLLCIVLPADSLSLFSC